MSDEIMATYVRSNILSGGQYSPQPWGKYYCFAVQVGKARHRKKVQHVVPGHRKDKRLLVFALLYTHPIHLFS